MEDYLLYILGIVGTFLGFIALIMAFRGRAQNRALINTEVTGIIGRIEAMNQMHSETLTSINSYVNDQVVGGINQMIKDMNSRLERLEKIGKDEEMRFSLELEQTKEAGLRIRKELEQIKNNFQMEITLKEEELARITSDLAKAEKDLDARIRQFIMEAEERISRLEE
jgi:DNA anti-recombination protein RmuC